MLCENIEIEFSVWRGLGAGKFKAWRTGGNRKEFLFGMLVVLCGDLFGMCWVIVEDGWDLVMEKDVFGSSVLMWVVGGGYVEACEFFVDECGVDFNYIGCKDGWVFLYWVVCNGEFEVC